MKKIVFVMLFLIVNTNITYSRSIIPSKNKVNATPVPTRATSDIADPTEKEKKIWEAWNWGGKGCDYEFQEHLLNGDLFADTGAGKKTADILMDGLKSDVCFAKWQSANMICEHLDSVDKNELSGILNTLINDESEKIRNAASFALAVLSRDYSNPKWFIKSPDGSKCVFTLFNDVTYKGYNVWIGEKDRIEKIPKGIGCITKMAWSPDGKYVAAESFEGRGTAYVTIVDVENRKIFKRIGDVDSQWFRNFALNNNIVPPNGNYNAYLSFKSWGSGGASVIMDWYAEIENKGTVEYDFINEKIGNVTGGK